MISNEEIKDKIKSWTKDYLGSKFEFREHQLESIIKIISNIVNKSCENYIVEAPTGSGKSIICIISAGVLAKYYGLTSYILCSDLYLWDQYYNAIKDLPDFGFLKGQTGNYQCKINKEDIRNSECHLQGISWHQLMIPKLATKLGYKCANTCKYVKERKKAIDSKVCLMTYQLFLYMNNWVKLMSQESNWEPDFQRRDIIFCDECHNIPDIVQGKFSPVININDLSTFACIYNETKLEYKQGYLDSKPYVFSKFKTVDDFKDYYKEIYNLALSSKTKDEYENVLNAYLNEFLGGYMNSLIKPLEDCIKDRKERGISTPEDLKLYKMCSYCSSLICHCEDFLMAVHAEGNQYIIKELSRGFNDSPIITFNYIKEDYMVSHFVLMNADYRVMMSATVGGKEAFDENIGIHYTESKNSEMDRIPSTFDFSKSPVIVLNKYSMGYKTKEASFKALKPIIYKLIEKHKGERGIIQTSSYENAIELLKDAPKEIKSRLLMYTNTDEKKKLLKIYSQVKGKVIIGPSLTEGIDMPDDLCRFIIILKVPYPSLTSQFVKEKMKIFPRWYASTTSNSIIQGIGRGNRNKNDYCTTYILDSCFKKLYNETYSQYSLELRERIKFYS